MATPEELYEQDLERLGELDEDQLYYLGNLWELEDEATDGMECGGDEVPKLTEEEWLYIRGMNDG